MTSARSAELVHVPVDGVDEHLAAAFYAERNGRSDVAILHLHGKGGNFYSGPSLFIPQEDQAGEFAHLSLNMRCHDLGYTRYDLPMPDVQEGVIPVGGGMWERMSDGVPDIAAGMAWLVRRGYTKIFLAGHSSGAYFAAEACAAGGLQIAGAVLLSTVISYKRNLGAWFPDGALEDTVQRARDLVASGAGHVLLPMDAWYYAISAASLVERTEEPDGIFERWLANIEVPVLFVSGAQEPRVPQWRCLFEEMPSEAKEWLVLEDVSHDYSGQERVLTEHVAGFVRRRAGASG